VKSPETVNTLVKPVNNESFKQQSQRTVNVLKNKREVSQAETQCNSTWKLVYWKITAPAALVRELKQLASIPYEVCSQTSD